MTTKCKTIIGHKANKGTCPNKAIKNEEYCTLHIWQKPNKTKVKLEKMLAKGLKDYDKHNTLEDHEFNAEWDCGYIEACNQLLRFINKK